MWMNPEIPVGKSKRRPRLMSRGAGTLTDPGAGASTALVTGQTRGVGMTECAHSREQTNEINDMDNFKD